MCVRVCVTTVSCACDLSCHAGSLQVLASPVCVLHIYIILYIRAFELILFPSYVACQLSAAVHVKGLMCDHTIVCCACCEPGQIPGSVHVSFIVAGLYA